MKSPGANRGIALTSILLLIIMFLLIGVSIVGLTTVQSRYSQKAGFDTRTRETALAGVRILQDVLSSIENWNETGPHDMSDSKISAALTVMNYTRIAVSDGKITYRLPMFGDYINELEICNPENDTLVAVSRGYVTVGTENSEGRSWEKAYQIVYRKNRFRYAAASIIQSGTGITVSTDSRINGDLCCLTSPGLLACAVGNYGPYRFTVDNTSFDQDGNTHVNIDNNSQQGEGNQSGAQSNDTIPGRLNRGTSGIFTERAFVPEEGDYGEPVGGDESDYGDPDGQAQTNTGDAEHPDNSDNEGVSDDKTSRPVKFSPIVMGSAIVMQNSTGNKARVQVKEYIRDGVRYSSDAPISTIDFKKISSLKQSSIDSDSQTRLDNSTFASSPVYLDAGAYRIGGFEVADSALVIKPVGGTVYLFVDGNVSIKGKLDIEGDPRSFMIFARGNRVSIGGSTGTGNDAHVHYIERNGGGKDDGGDRQNHIVIKVDSGSIYHYSTGSNRTSINNLFLEAPNADVSIVKTDITGSVIGNTIDIRNSTLTYPSSLLKKDTEKGRALIISLEELAASR